MDGSPVDSSDDAGDGNGARADAGDDADAGFDDSPNYVFVTSQNFSGDLGGLDGADAICNDAAQFAALPGTYRAWLSTDTTDAIDRLGDARGWIRPDGLPFADRVADIAVGATFYPPEVTENEGTRKDVSVWTATTADGRFNADHGDCDGWTSNSAELDASSGNTMGGPVAFTERGTRSGTMPSCDQALPLYCFGVDKRHAVEALGTGRVGFVSNQKTVGSAGLANFDEICQQEADEAGLDGSFRALVSLTDAPAPERFDTSGCTWVRPDGVRIYATSSDLGAGNEAIAPIAVTADGSTYVDEGAWTGALDYFLNVGDNCEDWSLVSATGSFGRSGLIASFEAFANTAGCGERKRLYCFEE